MRRLVYAALMAAGMHKRLLVIAALAVTTGSLAVTAKAGGNINIIDGDTIRMDGITIRIMELDTPETFKSRCENELVLGLAAKEHLRSLLDSGTVTYEASGADRYGRTLAMVHVGGINVGQQMIRDGVALSYQPGKDAKRARLRHRCGSDAGLDDTWKNTGGK
ncbi:endonuclease YncB(thermonuclease family) [Ensifer sp. WSM1721]|uniref:thermonuclease family protein n=1 Tax=Ensifer sp. WSM1721 TaxID=1041159 RepID=UPI0004BA9BDF|nr:thermonuclease family protein [Ensifer sp. WSM1721]